MLAYHGSVFLPRCYFPILIRCVRAFTLFFLGGGVARRSFIVDGLILYTTVSLLFTTYDCWYSKYEFPKLASAACGGRKKSETSRNPAGLAFIQIVPGW